MFDPRHRRQFAYDLFHSYRNRTRTLSVDFPTCFGLGLSLQNCISSTLGLILMITAPGKAKPFVIASATFAILTGVVTVFFFLMWIFTPLDADPHSAMTKVVLVFLPVISLALPAVGAAVAWLAAATL